MTNGTNTTPAWGHAEGILNLKPPQAVQENQQELDRAHVIDTLHRYGFAYDERRLEVLRGCFTDDAEFLGSVAGKTDIGPFRGWPAIAEFLEGHMTVQNDQRRHMLVSDIVEDLDASTASTVSYLMLTSSSDGAVHVVTSGFYRCDLHKGEDGVWRIARLFAGFDSAF
ncbi:nuclear transport factor 2 family protein [Saccharopolyspora mangrovi]|uniref:Nuclear transport factor 2 family protein n=1 Tax=Saccharopolyspora mangrovi TaxID=3082379 RepID=A0ABU6AJU5_9PSEU|nr:nuclear transport factor 2 family protein [Saccharopolyspora sp. S2-29]MEB3371732.1 nuclear transport factor 2 family protein [Saccharopolyspora sp. S2-29]